jgi:hypothetical protein
MSYQTHDLTEWAQFLSLGTGLTATGWLLWLLLFEPLLDCDLDPRPALQRAIESGRVDPLLVAVANAKYDARAAADRAKHIPRDAAITTAALLMLLSPAPKGHLR